MLKQFTLCATLIALGSGTLNAQQPTTMQSQEQLTRVEVPGADFDLIVATMATSATAATGGQNDPLDAGLWPTRVYRVPKGH